MSADGQQAPQAADVPSEAKSAAQKLKRPSATASAKGLAQKKRFLNIEDLLAGAQSARAKLTALRRAVYRAAPATSNGAVQIPPDSDFPAIAEIIRSGGKALDWAGSAFALMRACQAAGFRAWVYHFGFAEDFTPAVTIVDVDGRRVIQDAYLNQECDIDLVDALFRLQRGQRLLWRREESDRKVFLLPKGHQEDVGWIVAHSGLELEPVDGIRRFPLYARGYSERALKRSNGFAFDQLRRLGLPEDYQFLMLNPRGLFDGEGFHNEPSEMPVVKEWITERAGVTLARQLLDLPPADPQVRAAAERPPGPASADSASDLEGLIARVAAERRLWLEEKLDLQQYIDRAEYEARLASARGREDAARLDVLTDEVAVLRAKLADTDRDARRAEAQANAQFADAQGMLSAMAGQLADAERALSEIRAERDLAVSGLAPQLAEAEARYQDIAARLIENERHMLTLQSSRDAERLAATALLAEADARNERLADRLAIVEGPAAEAVLLGRRIVELEAENVALKEAAASAVANAAEVARLRGQEVEWRQERVDFIERIWTQEDALDQHEERARRLLSVADKEKKELRESAASVLAELSAAAGPEAGSAEADESDIGSVGALAARAVAAARKVVGASHAATIRVKMLEKDLGALQEERSTLRNEVAHLTAIANNSRYLKLRRAVGRLLRNLFR